MMNRFHSLWAMRQDHISPFIQTLNGVDLMGERPEMRDPIGETELMGYLRGEDRFLQYDVKNGIAKIDVVGPVMETVPFIYHLFGIEATDLKELQSVAEEVAAREDVTSVVLAINSPGGTVAGTQEAGAAIARIKDAGKPITATVSGMATSAGYWLASQADEIVATPLSQIGSIGVYSVVMDFSEAVASQGVKVTVVSSGGVKGAGYPGTEVTEDVIEDTQREVNEINARFVAEVMENRGLSLEEVTAMNTGQVWLASEAQKMGLIDRVEYIPASNIAISAAISPARDVPEQDEKPAEATAKNQEVSIMDKEQLKALLAEFPEHAALILSGDEDGKTDADIRGEIAEANKASHAEQVKALEESVSELEKANAELKTENENLKAKVGKAEEWAAEGVDIPDAGSDDAAADDSGDLSDETLRRQWDAMSQDEKNTYCDSFGAFVCCKREPAKFGVK